MRLVPRPWLAVATLTAAGAAAAAGYAATAPKHYEATAQLLVMPVPAGDSTYTGLDLLRSGGRRSAAASAAALVRSPQVADAVRAQLGLSRSRDSLLGSLQARAVDDSDVVAITVDDTSAAGAAQLANAFAAMLVSQRTASFQSQLATTIRRQEELLRTTQGAGADELRRRLAVLRSLQGQPDPTLRSAGQASAPEEPVSPKPAQLVLLGGGAGLAAGAIVALALAAPGLRRRPGAAPAPSYDHGVPERIVEQLEARLQKQLDALVEERERLAGREAALAARERDIAAKLEELRGAVPAQADDSDLLRREEELARREAELEARAAELATPVAEPAPGPDDSDLLRREQELAGREAELAARAAELAAPVAEPVPGPDDSDLLRREEELTARVAAVTQREVALARKAAELAARERELAEEPAPRREPEPVLPPPGPPPAPEPPAPARDGSATPAGRWNLVALERLVEQRGVEFPDRVDEWGSYLYFLREYAAADGTVPASFDWLIQDTFAELLP